MNRIAFIPLSFFFVALFGTDLVRPPADPAEFGHRVLFELEGGDANGDGCIDGRDIAAYVTQAGYAAMSHHPLAADYIAARRIWMERWRGTRAATVKDAIWRAAAGAEYQALTGDTRFQGDLIGECRTIVAGWPGGLDSYAIFVTNPEPAAVTLARIAEVNEGARAVLSQLLDALLRSIRDGTHGWANFGKTTWCRVELCKALGIPNDRFSDYGVNKGLAWLLDQTTNGWLHWMTGSPWYQIFNDVIVALGWDVRHLMTPSQLRAFWAVYYFPFEFQIDGKSPLVGEDWDKGRTKPYTLWTGYAWRWRGTDDISTFMRWRALHDLGMATHWNDLKCPPTPAACPAMPPLPPISDWQPYALAARNGKVERLWFFTALPTIDGAHVGLARERSLVVKK